MRIFISYAHRDGVDLAVRLQRDLEARGFDAWLERKRLKAGDRWTKEIEAALDRAQVVLALLSDGSFDSDTCRAEQGWALEAGKRVIPSQYCATPIPTASSGSPSARNPASVSTSASKACPD